jgi:hypothetical protein
MTTWTVAVAEDNERVTETPSDVLRREEEALKAAAHQLIRFLEAHDLVPSLTASRAWQLAQDVWVASETFRLAHGEATMKHQAEEAKGGGRLILQFEGTLTETSASDRFRGSFKSLLFAVRAHQDVMYVLLLLLRGQKPTGGSMDAAAKNPRNPVAELLSATIPDYLAWFSRWRDLRNSVKRGASFGIVGPTYDLGISINAFTDAGGLQVSFHEDNIIRISDAIAAVHACRRITELARVSARGRAAGYR